MGYNVPNEILVRTRKTAANPSGKVGYELDDVAKMPMGVFQRIQDNIIGARTQVYWDGAVLISGTALTVGQKVTLFREGQDEDGKIWNTGVVFNKTYSHTNMVEGGQFEYGVSVIVFAMEVFWIVPPAKANAYGGDGLITDSSDAAAQPALYNAPQFAKAIEEQCKFTFRRGSDINEENGLLVDLPSNSGIAASLGAQTNTQMVQNSLGPNSARRLDFPKVLHSKENFQVDLEQIAPTLPIPVTTILRFRLIGKRLRSAA